VYILNNDRFCKNWGYCNNYIQLWSIVQLRILRALEGFCMPDVGGQRVISREILKDVQLYNMHAVCDFSARA